MKTLFSFALFVTLAALANAQKVSVILTCSPADGDTIGMRLCTELRNEITASPRYQETHTRKQFHWGLHVTSLSVSEDSISAQSVVITIAGDDGLDLLMEDYVMTTGRNRIKDQAETIIAALDKEVDQAAKYTQQ